MAGMGPCRKSYTLGPWRGRIVGEQDVQMAGGLALEWSMKTVESNPALNTQNGEQVLHSIQKRYPIEPQRVGGLDIARSAISGEPRR